MQGKSEIEPHLGLGGQKELLESFSIAAFRRTNQEDELQG